MVKTRPLLDQIFEDRKKVILHVRVFGSDELIGERSVAQNASGLTRYEGSADAALFVADETWLGERNLLTSLWGRLSGYFSRSSLVRVMLQFWKLDRRACTGPVVQIAPRASAGQWLTAFCSSWREGFA